MVNRNRPVPVILFSGRHDAGPLAKAEGSPVIQVLTKPVKEADLKGAVELAKAEIVGV